MDIRKIIKELLGLDSLPKGDGLVGFTTEQLSEAANTARNIALWAKETKNVADLKAAVEAVETLTAEVKTRNEATEKDIAELSARIPAEASDQDNTEDDKTNDDDGNSNDGNSDDDNASTQTVKVESVVEAKPETELVTADATTVVPDSTTGPAANDEPPITLIAAGDVQGHSAGQALKVTEVADAMLAKADAVSRSRAEGRYSVGRLAWEYPSERILRDDDNAATNTKKVNAVIAAAQEKTRETLDRIVAAKDPETLNALTAAGGLCAPVNVRYEVFTVGTTARPLRDSLTRFGATRGGIRFNAPPTLASIRDTDAVNIYTEDQDTSGADYPKGCIRVGCGQDVEVTVSAITLCMEVGNYQRMFFGENFTAWWGLGRVEHARQAEIAIWNRLDTLSTNVGAGEGLGATPDTLAQVTRAAAQYRDRHRIDPETPLRLRAPSFLRDIMQTDLARRQPGDNTLAVSYAEIARYFAVRNIAVTWVLDGQYASGTSHYNQAAGALNPWPTTVDVNLSIDGTFLFLDGGTLDFGTEIRDFDQIRANDSGAFMETFENTAFVGPEAIMLTVNICPDGTTAGADTSFNPCTTGS